MVFLLGPIVERYHRGTILLGPANLQQNSCPLETKRTHVTTLAHISAGGVPQIFTMLFQRSFIHHDGDWRAGKKMIFVSTVAFRFPSCLRCKLQNLICWYLRWWARAKHSKCVFLKESKKSSVFTFLVAWSGKYGYPQITVCC